MHRRVILASASPQRAALLRGLGLSFDIVPSCIAEADCQEYDPGNRARLLARRKAEDVAARHPDALVIGCDTLVVANNGTILEKPVDAADARRMLALQSGTSSEVHSGLCVLVPGQLREALSSSVVTFRHLDDADLHWWITTNLWQGRSGGFQIEGQGQLLIERLDGDWTGVVGLPVALLRQLMAELGVSIV